MADLTAMAAAVERGDREAAVRLVKEALAEKVPAEKVLNEGLIAAMTNRFTVRPPSQGRAAAVCV